MVDDAVKRIGTQSENGPPEQAILPALCQVANRPCEILTSYSHPVEKGQDSESNDDRPESFVFHCVSSFRLLIRETARNVGGMLRDSR